MEPTVPSLRDRFTGCMLGHALGDGLGSPFEGLNSDYIFSCFGRPTEIIAKPPVEMLCCTDDTHMSIVIAEMLAEHGCIDTDRLIQDFAKAYEPLRGYGGGVRRLLEAVIAGEDWQAMAGTIFPGGSFGNGGAMRVAPIGLFFYEDLDRVWLEAGRSAAVTHRHPLGIEGAQLFATAVALATRGEAALHDAFFGELSRRAKEEEYQWLLRTASKLTPSDSLGLLGSGLEAQRSVVTAITCFSVAPDSFGGTLSRALALGNDTDTVMAMAGALSGAHLGVNALPKHLLEILENQDRGRDAILSLAGKLYERHLIPYNA